MYLRAALALTLLPVHVALSSSESGQAAALLVPSELKEARSLYNHAEYEDADKLYAQILVVDPANKAALEGKALTKQAFARDARHASAHNAEALSETYPAKPTPYDETIEPWAAKDSTTIHALKLSKIIIPEISMDGVTVAEALEILQRESRRFDTDPDPAMRGVKLSLTPPVGGLDKYELPARLPEQARAKVFLHLHNASLGEALEFVGHQIGLTEACSADQITLVQERSCVDGGLFLGEFRPWPELTEALNDKVHPKYNSKGYAVSGVFFVPRADAKPFLQAKGILFPPGATAAYLPPGYLFVTNTPENLDRMEALVDRYDGVGPPPADENP